MSWLVRFLSAAVSLSALGQGRFLIWNLWRPELSLVASMGFLMRSGLPEALPGWTLLSQFTTMGSVWEQD